MKKSSGSDLSLNLFRERERKMPNCSVMCYWKRAMKMRKSHVSPPSPPSSLAVSCKYYSRLYMFIKSLDLYHFHCTSVSRKPKMHRNFRSCSWLCLYLALLTFIPIQNWPKTDSLICIFEFGWFCALIKHAHVMCRAARKIKVASVVIWVTFWIDDDGFVAVLYPLSSRSTFTITWDQIFFAVADWTININVQNAKKTWNFRWVQNSVLTVNRSEFLQLKQFFFWNF